MEDRMTDQLNVDPTDLHMSSAHMDMHHAELQTVHSGANADIEAAQTGWVGASAAALQAKFAEWQATTTALCTDVSAHGAAFRSAAQTYVADDGEGARKLDQLL
jgi:WXG100 family type VII secretion target